MLLKYTRTKSTPPCRAVGGREVGFPTRTQTADSGGCSRGKQQECCIPSMTQERRRGGLNSQPQQLAFPECSHATSSVPTKRHSNCLSPSLFSPPPPTASSGGLKILISCIYRADKPSTEYYCGGEPGLQYIDGWCSDVDTLKQ